MRCIFGEITDPITAGQTVLTVKQLGEFRMSLQLAKKLTMIMLEQLRDYEERFGEIPVPQPKT